MMRMLSMSFELRKLPRERHILWFCQNSKPKLSLKRCFQFEVLKFVKECSVEFSLQIEKSVNICKIILGNFMIDKILQNQWILKLQLFITTGCVDD